MKKHVLRIAPEPQPPIPHAQKTLPRAVRDLLGTAELLCPGCKQQPEVNTMEIRLPREREADVGCVCPRCHLEITYQIQGGAITNTKSRHNSNEFADPSLNPTYLQQADPIGPSGAADEMRIRQLEDRLKVAELREQEAQRRQHHVEAKLDDMARQQMARDYDRTLKIPMAAAPAVPAPQTDPGPGKVRFEATQDMRVGGRAIRKGEMVVLEHQDAPSELMRDLIIRGLVKG